MPRLFGTDGIRGVANVDLKPTLAYGLGRATAHRLVGVGGALVVGQDTRRSCDMFVAAITAGATSTPASRSDSHSGRASLPETSHGKQTVPPLGGTHPM